MAGREPSADELAEDFAELKRMLEALMAELKAGYVPRELYEANHRSLRAEIALEMAAMRRDVDSKASAETANATNGRVKSLEEKQTWATRTAVTALVSPLLVGVLVFLLTQGIGK